MGDLTRNFPIHKRLGKALVGALPVHEGFFERVGATEFGPVQTEFALPAVGAAAGVALAAPRFARPGGRITLAALPNAGRNLRQRGNVTSAVKGFGTKIATDQRPAAVAADVAVVVVVALV